MNVTPTAAQVRELLGARGSNARCPAHEDTQASLSISDGANGKPLLQCHAGCSQSAVIEALQTCGIWPKAAGGLTVADLAGAKHLPESLLRDSGFADDIVNGRPVVRMDYRDASGNVSCVRYRGTIEKTAKGPRFWFRKGDKQQLFGLWRLRPEDVIVVEGETDSVALWDAGFNVIGVPGADAWQDARFAEHLKNCPQIYVHLEPDTGGKQFGAKFEASSLRKRVRFFTVPDAKDPCELYGRDSEGFRAKIETALAEASPAEDASEDALNTPLVANAEKSISQEERDVLVKTVATDAGAPFKPETLKKLVALKKEDRAAFEVLRAQLKQAGCRVTALDETIAEESGGGGRGPTQADVLIELAITAELFHRADGTGFADLDINGHRETWPIRATGFRRWLSRRFFEKTRGAPSSEALQSALNVIEARAHYDAPARAVHIRVGGLDGRLYLDLADETWTAIEIGAEGWRVIKNPPVRFRRAAGMQALPTPISGGSVNQLRPFLNVKSDADFALVVAWTLAVLRNSGPYPVLTLSGEQGSAKSTFSAILRSLLDPNTAPLRALPGEDRDLFIAASNGHVLAFDNVSGLQPWISDTLCRLATGGGFAVRQLYTDQDEVLFDAARPVILNGIEDIVTRPDLADRALFLTLEAISEEKRQPEQTLWAAFERERPYILGALLDAVVHGLRELPKTKLAKLPRMADFALWATACEGALRLPVTFWSAYSGNREESIDSVLDADLVATAVRKLMETRTVWTQKAADLLGALTEAVGDSQRRAKTWPDNPRALSGRLRRAAPFLRKVGITITFEREGHSRTRTIRITADRAKARSSAPSAPPLNSNQINGVTPQCLQTVGDDAGEKGGDADGPNPPTIRINPLKTSGMTDADGADAKSTTRSDPEEDGSTAEVF